MSIEPTVESPPGESPHAPGAHPSGHQSFWLWVMCLTGVDYFSTLGYQPSIAFEAAGLLAPLATVVLVLVTLLGALPVYSYVAEKSPHGLGSIAMLERLVHGWTGKALVLVLLGFAATDFVITMTLSSADAAEHVVHNPLWSHAPAAVHGLAEDNQRLVVTMFLLIVLGAMFMRGFREVIGLAVVIVGAYLALNAIVIGSGLFYLATHPGRLTHWIDQLNSGQWHLHEAPLAGSGWPTLIAVSLLIFPKLALGLSGFETGIAVMPLIKGEEKDGRTALADRIRNTRKLLLTSALIMSVFLMGSSLVTATLIEPEALVRPKPAGLPQQVEEPPAANRALAYLAHGETPFTINPLFGEVFGTIYDLCTVLILAFAGASAMAALLNLVPQYLPRYGMAPEWSRVVRPLVVLFTSVNLFVTWVFNADVSAQGSAYATGVLVLISSAGVATVIDRYRSRTGSWFTRISWLYVLITLVFFYTTAANMIERSEGVKIASFFILAVIVTSGASRLKRSTELRFGGFEFEDLHSRFLWDTLKHLEFPVLVPHRPGGRGLAEKEASIRARHRLPPEVPIVFVEAGLGDPSEFQHNPLLEIVESEGRFVLRVKRCASVAHVIATIALELSKVGKPPEIHFGWSDESPLTASAGFILFGEGNVPWLVRELIRKSEPDPARRPHVIIG